MRNDTANLSVDSKPAREGAGYGNGTPKNKLSPPGKNILEV